MGSGAGKPIGLLEPDRGAEAVKDSVEVSPRRFSTANANFALSPASCSSYHAAAAKMSAETLGSKFQPEAHRPNLFCIRALNSSSEIADSGFASCSARRASISFFSSSVSGSSSSSQPSLSISASLTRISYRSSLVSLGSSCRISDLLITGI